MLKHNRLVMGNWKMNASLHTNLSLLEGVLAGLSEPLNTEVAVCVPFPYLAQVQNLLNDTPITWGAQDLSACPSGAYTGQVSASMLKEFGCQWVLVGHSERRQYQHETNEEIALKALQALEYGIRPVVCVGESLHDYQAGLRTSIIKSQLQPVIHHLKDLLSQIIVAYEPVWAIGTGLSASADEVQNVHEFIQQLVGNIPILYGGSVKPDNASDLFKQPTISGVLVGGASLSPKDFLGIINA